MRPSVTFAAMVLIRTTFPLTISTVVPLRIESPPGWPRVHLAELGDGSTVVLVDGRSGDGKYSLPGSVDLDSEVRATIEALDSARSEATVAATRVTYAKERRDAARNALDSVRE